jgi:hypothetical protein
MTSSDMIEYYRELKAMDDRLYAMMDSLEAVKAAILELKLTNDPPVDPNA